MQKEIRLKVYNMLAVPMITYGCETWTLKKSDEKRIAVAEIKFMRRTARVTPRDRARSETMTLEPGVMQIMKKIESYRKKLEKTQRAAGGNKITETGPLIHICQ